MRNSKFWLVLASVLAMLALSGCHFGFGYYKTMAQPAAAVAAVKGASAFKVRPLDYSAVKFADLGYESAELMTEEFANFNTDFASHFKEMWATEGVSPKAVQMVGAADDIGEGIVVDTVIDRIQLNWNSFSNQADDFFITVTFTDAAAKAQLFQGKYQVKNSAFSSGFGQSMAARLNNAAYNIVWLLIKLMSYGQAQPAQY